MSGHETSMFVGRELYPSAFIFGMFTYATSIDQEEMHFLQVLRSRIFCTFLFGFCWKEDYCSRVQQLPAELIKPGTDLDWHQNHDKNLSHCMKAQFVPKYVEFVITAFSNNPLVRTSFTDIFSVWSIAGSSQLTNEVHITENTYTKLSQVHCHFQRPAHDVFGVLPECGVIHNAGHYVTAVKWRRATLEPVRKNTPKLIQGCQLLELVEFIVSTTLFCYSGKTLNTIMPPRTVGAAYSDKLLTVVSNFYVTKFVGFPKTFVAYVAIAPIIRRAGFVLIPAPDWWIIGACQIIFYQEWAYHKNFTCPQNESEQSRAQQYHYYQFLYSNGFKG